jgi:hypothetical protein
MDEMKPKKWDVQNLQESKKIKQAHQRKTEEKIREYKEEANIEENWKMVEKVIKEVSDETVDKDGNQRVQK